jgi:hypothetical protein
MCGMAALEDIVVLVRPAYPVLADAAGMLG